MISKEEVQNLAALARLDVSEAEAASLQTDISNILEYIGHVSAVSIDTKETAVPGVHNVLRADQPRQANDPMAGKEESVKAAFPTREGQYNVVRKIIQKDE